MQLTIIIVNYNVKYFLQLCLQSVACAIKNIEAEVFVVDNNSSDGSVEMVQQKFPFVKLIANKQNLGFGAANNQAIALAQGKYILLQNPDTVVAEDTFDRIVDFMELKPDAGGLGVKMIDGVGKFLPESKRGLPTPEVAFYKIFGLSVLFPKSKVFGKYHLGFLDKREIHVVDVLSGAFMLIRKEVFDKIGAFDEQFFMYGEDIDLSYRIAEAGYKNYYYPGTTIIHYKGESTKKGSLNYVFVFYKAMIIFARKHFASQKAALFSLLINSAVYIRAGIELVFQFIKLFRRPFIDAAVMLMIMIPLTSIYESYKFHGEGKFPESMLTLNIPLYVFLWIAGLFFTNNYSKSFPKVISQTYGMLLGTLSISVVYAFLSEDLRASRAIILIGAFANLMALIGVRWLWQIIANKKIGWYNQNKLRILVVGDGADVPELTKLQKRNALTFKLTGYAGTNQQEELNPDFLGHYARLHKILKLYRADEIIFVTEKTPWKEVISEMEEYRQKYRYKFFNRSEVFSLGSNSKNIAGEILTNSAFYALSTPESKYNKRFTDLILTLVLGCTGILIIPFVNNKKGFLMNILNVLSGDKSWVGFTDAGFNGLPKIKSGVIKTTYSTNMSEIRNADISYAENYSSLSDVTMVLKKLNRLGD